MSNKPWPFVSIFMAGMVLFAACDDSDSQPTVDHSQHQYQTDDGSSDLSGTDGGIDDDSFDPPPACGPYTPGC